MLWIQNFHISVVTMFKVYFNCLFSFFKKGSLNNDDVIQEGGMSNYYA